MLLIVSFGYLLGELPKRLGSPFNISALFYYLSCLLLYAYQNKPAQWRHDSLFAQECICWNKIIIKVHFFSIYEIVKIYYQYGITLLLVGWNYFP